VRRSAWGTGAAFRCATLFFKTCQPMGNLMTSRSVIREVIYYSTTSSIDKGTGDREHERDVIRLPIRLGRVLKNQMWATGTASSMCPCARGAPSTGSPRAATVADHAAIADALVLAAMALQSFTGTKMRSQKRPSFSALNDR